MYLVQLHYDEFASGSTDIPVCYCSTEEEALKVLEKIEPYITNKTRYSCSYDYIHVYKDGDDIGELLKIKIKEFIL